MVPGNSLRAGSMVRRHPYRHHDADLTAFSRQGLTWTAGKIDNGGANNTYEGFVNPAPSSRARRRFGYRDIPCTTAASSDNLLTTRHWVNGSSSDERSLGRQQLQHAERRWRPHFLKQVFTRTGAALLTYTIRPASTRGAWDSGCDRFRRA